MPRIRRRPTRRLIAHVTALAMLALATSSSATSQAPVSQSTGPPGWRFIASVEGATEYRLVANGLRVLLMPDSSEATLTANMVYEVGSRHERGGETGAAHLLEHLLLRGTRRFPSLKGEMKTRGARWNGTTYFDRTNFYEVLEATPENLAWAIAVEADRMRHADVSAAALAAEMTVVRNELETTTDFIDTALEERVHSAAFAWHAYGRPTIGARADIERMPIETLRRFYELQYRPDRATLVLAGRFDPAEALTRVAREFSKIAPAGESREAGVTSEPAQDGERRVVLRRPAGSPQLWLSYHVPAASHPDLPALRVLAAVFTDSISGRWTRSGGLGGSLLRWRAPFVPTRDPGLFSVWASTAAGVDPAEAADRLAATLESVRSDPPSEDEIARARRRLLREWRSVTASSSETALELTEWIAAGDWRLFFHFRDAVAGVSPADCRRVAAYLTRSNRTLGLAPEGSAETQAAIPAAPPVDSLLAHYRGGARPLSAEARPLDARSIEARLIRSQLPGGMRLIVLPRRTRGGRLVAQLSFRVGNADSLRGKRVLHRLCVNTLLGGTGRRTRREVLERFEELDARVDVTPTFQGANVTIESDREHFGALLREIAEVLRHPAFPDSEVARQRARFLDERATGASDPVQIANDAILRWVRGDAADDPRYFARLEENTREAAMVTRARLRDYHARFFGMSDARLVVVGDVDPTELRKMVEASLAGGAPAVPVRPLPDACRPGAPAVDSLIPTPGSEGAAIYGGLRVPVGDTHPDYPALLAGMYLMGGGGLHSRIATRLREKDGFAYHASAWINTTPGSPCGRIWYYAIFAPSNRDSAEVAIREETERALADGFAEEEVRDGITGWLEEVATGRARDAALARELATLDAAGRTLIWQADFEDAVRRLDGATILAALRRHLDLDRMSFFSAGAFESSVPRARRGAARPRATGFLDRLPVADPSSPEALRFVERERAWIGQAERAMARLDALARPFTVTNTLEPYNDATQALDAAAGWAELFSRVHPDSSVRDAAAQCLEVSGAMSQALGTHPRLFEAVGAIDTTGLDAGSRYLLGTLRRGMSSLGVGLDSAARADVESLAEAITEVGQRFMGRIERGSRTIRCRPAQLRGLPEDFRAAHPPGADGRVTLSTRNPDYTPVMAYAEDDSLRRALYEVYMTQGAPANLAAADTLISLRHRQAVLRGHADWASFLLQFTMAGSPDAVESFLQHVDTATAAPARAAYEALLARKRRDHPAAGAVEPWEWKFYETQLKRERADFDPASVRGYFSYRKVRDGVLAFYERLFGLRFVRLPEGGAWSPEVEAFELRVDGRRRGTFYLDMHPRSGKYTHNANFSAQRGMPGRAEPVNALVCNFPGGPGASTDLMEHSQVVTFFHEFGHLLHAQLGGTQHWVDNSGNGVELDFVEAPSQLFEEWAWQPEVLRTFAMDSAGRSIPAEQVRRMRTASEFTRALDARQLLANARIALALHRSSARNADSLARAVMGETMPFPFAEGTHPIARFGHLVSYSSNYYAYLWSRVIAKDLWSALQRDGVVDPSSLRRLRRQVLEPGASRSAREMVRAFLGRDARSDAYRAWVEGRDTRVEVRP